MNYRSDVYNVILGSLTTPILVYVNLISAKTNKFVALDKLVVFVYPVKMDIN